MDVQFVFRQFRGTDELRDLVEQKLETRLGRYLNGTHAEARVTIATEKSRTQIDFVLTAFGEIFKVSRKTQNDIYPVIDALIDKLERQVLKWKDMVKDRRARRA